jgi:hypothetical protein
MIKCGTYHSKKDWEFFHVVLAVPVFVDAVVVTEVGAMEMVMKVAVNERAAAMKKVIEGKAGAVGKAEEEKGRAAMETEELVHDDQPCWRHSA